MIDVHCLCGKHFQVADEMEGRVGRCSACGRQVAIVRQDGLGQDDGGGIELVDHKAEERATLQAELDALREAVAEDPSDPEPHVKLGDLCTQIGHSQEALDHYRTAYILDPSREGVLDRIEALGGPAERARLEAEDEGDAGADEFWRLLSRAFTFPFSPTGVAVLIGGALLFWGVLWMLGLSQASFSLRGRFFGFLLTAATVGYLTSYAFDIIGHVANGGDEPPDWPQFGASEGLRRLFLLALCCVVCLAPGGIYFAATRDTGPGLWGSAAVGLFFFPMCLLAVAILNSPLALLPHVILPAVLRTGTQYLAVTVVVFLAYGLAIVSRRVGYIPFVSHAVAIYFLLVEMYAIGVLYRTNESRIGWFSSDDE